MIADIEHGNITRGIEYLLHCAERFNFNSDSENEEYIQWRKEMLENAKVEQIKAESLSYGEFVKRENEKALKRIKEARGFIERMEMINSRYSRIRKDIVMWKPPTPEHSKIKEYALEQIDKSVYPREMFDAYQQVIERTNVPLGDKELQDLFHEYKHDAEQSVIRAEERYKEAIELAEKSKRFNELLYESLEEIDERFHT